MQVWMEEVFGPVLCVKTFSPEVEAIELANDTQWVHFFLEYFWKPISVLAYGLSWELWLKCLLFVSYSYDLGVAVISKDLERCECMTKIWLDPHLEGLVIVLPIQKILPL